jgi:hypothetical protein
VCAGERRGFFGFGTPEIKCVGDFQRDLGDDEHAEIMIADRTYRVRLADLA